MIYFVASGKLSPSLQSTSYVSHDASVQFPCQLGLPDRYVFSKAVCTRVFCMQCSKPTPWGGRLCLPFPIWISHHFPIVTIIILCYLTLRFLTPSNHQPRETLKRSLQYISSSGFSTAFTRSSNSLIFWEMVIDALPHGIFMAKSAGTPQDFKGYSNRVSSR